MTTEIEKQTLIQIVDKCQNRTFSDQITHIMNLTNNPTEWLINGLKSDLKNGITEDQLQIQNRINKYGSNKKQIKQPPGFWELFFGALEDFTLRILIVASFLSIAIEVGTAKPKDKSHAWIQGFAILMAVIICATVSAVNDYQKQRQFLKLNEVADARKKVTLMRDGKTKQLHQDDVLVGDVIYIHQGMEIPADGYLLSGNQITTDQSAMTGQSQPISKSVIQKCFQKQQEIIKNGQKNTANKYDIPSPILLSGTKVLTGEGKLLVLVVGQSSCLGKIRTLLDQQDPEPTPLQMKLQKIAEDIGTFGLYSAIVILIVLLVRFTVQKGISKNWETSKDLPQILNYFILGITVIVVAIPEGLPLSVTLSLAFSVKKMLYDQNLVRRMQACQTMGGANNILSDKTGTLTMNKMILTSFWNGSRVDFDNYTQNLDIKKFMSQKLAELFLVSGCVNSSAILRPQPKGSSTEQAMLKLVEKMSFKYQTYRQKYPTILKYPFSSKRKRMSSIIQFENQRILLIKGASEIIFSGCQEWFNQQTNTVQMITQNIRNDIQNIIKQMASQSLRTLCLAYKPIKIQTLDAKDQRDVFEIQKSQLILIAVVGIKDIPRPEVPEAIRKCKMAGIRVRMVTGDNALTAKAIAKQVGIIQNQQQSLVMEGPQFAQLTGGIVCKKCKTSVCDCENNIKAARQNNKSLRIDTLKNMDQFKKIIKNLDVLARSRPQDKYALVTGIKQLGNVVAVTGDGTNDAPALKKADIGFAMGISGTQVARQAASIILLDDNFNSIVKAVIWGRNIYDSIKKFIQFQLTVNVVAVAITIIGAATLKQQILKPIQMLWINLIMDTLASLALATEPPTQKLLERPPHSRDQYIISKKMFKHIICQSIFQIIVLLVLVFLGQFFIPQFPDQFDQIIKTNMQVKYHGGMHHFGTVRSGRLFHIDGHDDYISILQQYGVYSRHFTFIFNTFVMMQVINFFNSRKLNDEYNIFEGITNNGLFLIIVFLILGLQAILISFGSIAFGVYSFYGLTIQQWLISISIASISFIVNLLAKLIPENKLCFSFGNEEINPLERKQTSLNLKRSNSSFKRNINLNRSVTL